MMTLTAKTIASMIGVNPRTQYRAAMAIDAVKDAAFREMRYDAAYYHIGDVAQRIQHATGTGRIGGTAILAFRDMTPYQVCGLVARVASQVETFAGMVDDDAVAIIRTAIGRKEVDHADRKRGC